MFSPMKTGVLACVIFSFTTKNANAFATAKIIASCKLALGLSTPHEGKIIQIHNRYLSPRDARLVLELRKNTLFGRKLKFSELEKIYRNTSAVEYQTEYNFLLNKILAETERWNNAPKENLTPGPSYESGNHRKMALEQLIRAREIEADVKKRGYPTQMELIEMGNIAITVSAEHIPNTIYSPINNEWASIKPHTFVATPFILNPEGNHLGFRTLNDYSAIGVSPIEIPRLKDKEKLFVDGQAYSFDFFMWHDGNHSNLLESNGINYELSKSINKDATYFNILEARVELYEKMRSYIDQLPTPKERLLAEGIWFTLDHELHIAYEGTSYNGLVVPRNILLSLHILNRFQDKGDLGQAFKNSDWINADKIQSILREFTAISGITYDIVFN